jgi:hypothetical protein
MKNPYLPFFGHEFKQKKREKAKRERERERERERGFTLFVYKTAPALLSARKNVFVSFVGWLYVLPLLYE